MPVPFSLVPAEGNTAHICTANPTGACSRALIAVVVRQAGHSAEASRNPAMPLLAQEIRVLQSFSQHQLPSAQPAPSPRHVRLDENAVKSCNETLLTTNCSLPPVIKRTPCCKGRPACASASWVLGRGRSSHTHTFGGRQIQLTAEMPIPISALSCFPDMNITSLLAPQKSQKIVPYKHPCKPPRAKPLWSAQTTSDHQFTLSSQIWQQHT